MITGALTIKSLSEATSIDAASPIEIALASYAKWKSAVPFLVDLTDYLVNGVVIARPDIFVMAKIIDLAPEGAAKPEPAWFARIAVGNLKRLIAVMPCYLPRICFCRKGEIWMRVYSTERFMKLVGAIDLNRPGGSGEPPLPEKKGT